MDKPVAFAIFAENGNIRLWSKTCEEIELVAVGQGLQVIPLYTEAAYRREKERADKAEETNREWQEKWLNEGVPLSKKGITMVATDGE